MLKRFRRKKSSDEPRAPSPTVLPEGFLRIVALPISWATGIYCSFSGKGRDEVAPNEVVVIGAVLLGAFYFIYAKLLPLIIFCCLAQFLLLLGSEEQEFRVAGAIGIFIVICFCLLLKQGIIQL